MILQKVYQHLASYHTNDHSDDLAIEPFLRALFEKNRLASQPTLSRFNKKADIATATSLEHVNETLKKRVYRVRAQNQFVLDLDSSSSAPYGKQHVANFNDHYQQHGFHRMFRFDGLTGDCLSAELRAGNVYTSRQIVRFVGPILTRYEKWVPSALMVIRLKSNTRLQYIWHK